MIESRCGICCTQCNAKESYGVDCPGCVNIAKPFWGNCSVKSCCEGKGLSHCGECADFACELLKSFSYATDGHGDDGERIRQCEKWRRAM